MYVISYVKYRHKKPIVVYLKPSLDSLLIYCINILITNYWLRAMCCRIKYPRCDIKYLPLYQFTLKVFVRRLFTINVNYTCICRSISMIPLDNVLCI